MVRVIVRTNEGWCAVKVTVTVMVTMKVNSNPKWSVLSVMHTRQHSQIYSSGQ